MHGSLLSGALDPTSTSKFSHAPELLVLAQRSLHTSPPKCLSEIPIVWVPELGWMQPILEATSRGRHAQQLLSPCLRRQAQPPSPSPQPHSDLPFLRQQSTALTAGPALVS